MRSNEGMADRQGDVDLREAQVSAPQSTLWLDTSQAYYSDFTQNIETDNLTYKVPDMPSIKINPLIIRRLKKIRISSVEARKARRDLHEYVI